MTAVTTLTDADAAPSYTRIALDTLREERAAWLFVLRTAIAFYLTGWLAMRLALPQPGTAMMTSAIMANRQTGMVLAKSFYRAIGTLVGATAALLLVGLFPQERAFLLAALALWIGICAGGATLFRNFAAYSFVLSGYTASVIALPAIADPLYIFDSAVARISEVLLGILVTGVVSDTVFPTRLRDTLLQSAKTQFQHFMRFVGGAARGDADGAAVEQAHLRSMREAIALEDLRSSVIFEDPVTRARSELLRAFNHLFMAASTSLQSLHRLLDRLRRIGHARAAAELAVQYRLLGEALDVPADVEKMAPLLIPRLEAARPRVAERGERARASLGAETADFDTGNVLLLRLVDELYRYAQVALALRAPHVTQMTERVRFVRSNDVAGALVSGLRGTLTMLALGLFWIESAWPSGAGAMLIAAIFSSIYASSPDPVRATNQLLIGWIGGVVASFFTEFFAMSQVSGYGLLIATSLPMFMIGFYLMTRPTLAAIGSGYSISFISNLALTNAMSYDAAHFFNDAIAQLTGVAVAALAFRLLPSHSGSAWFQRRQFARLRGQIAVAARAPLAGLLHRFESAVRDLQQQITASAGRGEAGRLDPLAWGLAVHETGRALIELRQAAVGLAPPAAAAVEAAVSALAQFYERPDAQRYRAANEIIVAAIDTVQAAAPDAQTDAVRVHLHLLRLAMLDTASVVAEYRHDAGESKENPDAA
ncbi:MAG: FUSC family protein [Rudaea sp.]|uniref:FUSC family protein n=1 Tax=Rudaea sp. TaxID=2136325 RepID=UPI0039E4945C